MEKLIVDNYEFEIVTEVPKGYKIWNIPTKGLEWYLPLYELAEGEKFKVNVKTLKAIKCENGIVLIKDAASWGVSSTEKARKIINDKRSSDNLLLRARTVLPLMEEIKGL